MTTREHLTCENVAAGLREYHGNMAAVARKHGITRAAVHHFIARRPALLEVVRECREAMKDHAESALHRALLNGEAWAVRYYLNTQAKDRGYVELVEVKGVSDDEIDAEVERELARLAAAAAAAGAQHLVQAGVDGARLPGDAVGLGAAAAGVRPRRPGPQGAAARVVGGRG